MVEIKFKDFVSIVKKLRTDCPWDKEQTNQSIKAATIEEVYEAVDALDKNDFDEFKNELGDVLFHVVFHSVIAEDSKLFNLEEVIQSISDKLVRRHPHVFADVKVNDSNNVKKNWEMLKLEEGRDSLFEGIPSALPSLLRAYRVQEKAAKVGFDWERKEEVWKKFEEEIHELKSAEKRGNKELIEDELGDLFFSLVNYSRFIGFNPEDILRKATCKFERRFNYIEKKLKEMNKDFSQTNLTEMENFWQESKTRI